MRLFRYRPLAAACALFIFSLLSAYFLPLFAALWLSLGFFLAAILWLVFRIFRGFGYRSLLLFLSLLGLFLGSFRVLCEQSASKRVWDARYEQMIETEFTVKEVLYAATYGTELLVDVEAINGEKVSSDAVLRVDVQLPFYVGDRVSAALTVQPLDFEAVDSSAEYRYRAKGAKALLVAETIDSFSLIASGTNTLKTRLLNLRAVLSHRIAAAVGGEQGKLLAAMLLGSKELLSDTTVRNFSFSGVSHLLALSGLHLVILAGMIERLLYLLGVGKRMRIALLLPLCIFYLMLTGCNYSLMRAIFMLGFVYLCAILREDHDSMTALLLAGVTILLFTPYAIFSVSFQMTMLATFGILAFVRIQVFFEAVFPKGRSLLARPLWRLVRFVCSSLILSISTTVMLLPVLWLEIGSYAVVTPLCNLVMVPLAPLILFSAVLVLLLPFSIVGAVAGLPAQLLLFLADLFASWQATVSLYGTLVPFIVIPVVAATVLLLVIDLKRLYPLSFVPAVVCMLAFTAIFFTADMEQSLSVIYRQSGKNEGIVLVRGSEAMICDLSNTSFTQLRTDWREAQRQGATRLRALLLTHYHSKSATAVSRFAKSTIVGQLWLPRPIDEAQTSLFEDLLEVALREELQIVVYDTNKELTVFDTAKLSFSEHVYRSRSTEPAFCLTLCGDHTAICYHTASYDEYLAAKNEQHACHAEHLILGAHGPVPKKEMYFSDAAAQSILVGNTAHLPLLQLPEDRLRILAPRLYQYELE